MKMPGSTSLRSFISTEAVVGLGMTVASLGVLFLLLGLAQSMREVHEAARILLTIGGILFVLGAVGAVFGRTSKGH